MKIASELGGFSLGKADILRRAIGKKSKDEMNRLRDEFIRGCIQNGIKEETARKIYQLI